MIDGLRWKVVSAAEHEALGRGAPPARFLSAREQQVFAGFRFEARRRKWLLGRWAAKRLLAEVLDGGVEPDRITVANDPAGAPYAELEGRGRLPWSLSLSHREDLAVAAVREAEAPPIGIDLEMVAPRDPALVRTFFSDAEAEVVAGLEGRAAEVAVARIWSAKEAVLKAMGTGLRVDTRTVVVSEVAGGGMDGWLPLRVDVDVEGEEYRAMWRDEGRYVLTAAARR